MKHLNTEIIASIIEGKLNKSELGLYKKHIDQCDDCLIMYSAIKSNINNMNKNANIQVPDNLYTKIEKELFPEKKINLSSINQERQTKQTIKSQYTFNSYLMMSLSAAACLVFVFYVSTKKTINNENMFAQFETEKVIREKQVPSKLRASSSDNGNSNAINFLNKIIEISDFQDLELKNLIDSLNILKINYTIVEKSDLETIQISNNHKSFINIETDSITIFIPTK